MAEQTRASTSGSSRPLLLRMRSDLRIQRHNYLGRQYFVIKDPIGLKYYRFEEEEFALLEMLDGRTGLDELQAQFERRFAPQKITRQEIHQLVGMLHRSSLVVADSPGQGPQLLKRGRENQRRQRAASLMNVLCIRFKGFDPDRLLGFLDQRIGWLFSTACLALTVVLAVAALLLVSVQFDEFQAKLPAFQDFFASKNWIWLALVLGATKVLHEFGHGLACKRFGGECHEMGFMLLVLTPCLYCNVSDSWMLGSKWKRAAIGAAGMYVEVVLASLCTFLWWFSEPGLLNYICLNVMFVCSVSTLLFNANPLLRYDGYYILSDLVEIPNLRQKATTILQRKLGSWLLGLEEAPDPFLPQRRQVFFAIYAVASAVYRWVVVAAILWFLHSVFEPHGLQIIGQMLACVAIVGLVFQPLRQLVMFFYIPGRIDRVKKPRLMASMAAASLLVVGVFLIPLPHSVRCTLYLQPRDADVVYVDSPGALRQVHARPGAEVLAGQPLVSLENVDLRIAIARHLGERQKLESRLAALRQRSFEDANAGAQIDEVTEEIASLEEQLEKRRRDIERLEIRAPRAGVVIPPPRIAKPERDSGRLPGWYGSPLDERNTRAFFTEGVPVCHVGDPRKLEAVLAIDQGDIEFVRSGQVAEVFLRQLPGQRLRTQIEQISQVDMRISPRSLSNKAGGDLLTRTDASGRERPMSTTYQASARIDDESGTLFVGATGNGKIHAGYQTVAQRLWRYLSKTFNLTA